VGGLNSKVVHVAGPCNLFPFTFTIVAAKDDQPAMEGYKGHGVFTYVLLKALQETDKYYGNGDKQTSIFKISSYVDEKVPKITFKAFGYEQVPKLNMQGSHFPIAIVH
jgi:hypothetical protein